MGIFGSIRNAIFGQAREAQVAATGSSAIPAVGTPAQPPASQQPVDVEAVLTCISSEKGNPDLNWRSSIVDLMKLLDLDSSLDNRKELATELGYTGAKDGSAEMNIWLHKQVMRKLEENGGKVSADLRD